MTDRKKVWFSFLPLDYLGVEKYLNDYAAQGWALSETSDCRTLTVTLERSNRKDLRYFVSCTSLVRDQAFMRERVAQMQGLGWQPVATINHFDIYASMPCRHAVVDREKPSFAMFLWSVGSFVLFLGLSLFLLLLAHLRGVSLLDGWYLSNCGILLHFLSPIVGIAGIYYLLWVGYRLLRRGSIRPPQKVLLIFRGSFPILAMGWSLCLTAIVVTDLVHNLPYCLVLILALLGATLFCCIRFRFERTETLASGVSLTFALVLALSLILNQVFPNESRAELGECAWRNSLSAVVHGEEVGFDSTSVQAVSYEKEGSLFVDRTEYWEEREDLSLSSTVYRCKGTWLCSIVQKDLLQTGDWKQVGSVYDDCWSADQGEKHVLLLRTANTLILLSSDQELLPKLGEFSLHLE